MMLAHPPMRLVRSLSRGVFAGFTMLGCLGHMVTSLQELPLDPTDLAATTGAPATSIVAVGGSQQLSVTGTSVSGTPIATFDSVLYQYRTPSDSTRLRLTSAGVATGVTAGGAAVLVNIIAFKGRMIRGDEVQVQVTPTVIAGPLTFSLQPVAPDSAKLASGTIKTIVPVLRNATTGASVTSPAIRLNIRGSDSTRMDVFRGPVNLTVPGSGVVFQVTIPNPLYTSLVPNQIVALKGEGAVWVYAAVNAYGTVLQDSVLYTLSYPYTRTISTVKVNLAVQNLYAGQTLILAPGAVVTFQNGIGAGDPLTIAYTFDNPAAVTAAVPPSTVGGASGNVTPLTGGQTSNRRFLTPGTIHWTATAAGGPAPWPGQTQAGTIVIK